MTAVALVDKVDKGINYKSIFSDIDLDIYHLSSSQKKKLLKADKDIEIDIDEYDYIILVGAEPTKHFTTASVSSHQGYLVEEKFLPIIDPGMLVFKPSMEDSFIKAKNNIVDYIQGTTEKKTKRESIGIQGTEEAIKALEEILSNANTYVSLDTETTALYPRDGILLGISIASEITKGYYISADCLEEDCLELLQQIVDKYCTVFHNAKFDMSWLAYHLGIKFHSLLNVENVKHFEDTMLMHYILDETTGTHGLKENCIKYTDLGDYDRELDLFKRSYCKQHKIRLGDFNYAFIPFDTMYPYAAKDAMGTLELFEMFSEALNNDDRLLNAYTMIKKGSSFLVHVENNGVPFSTEKLLAAQESLANDIYGLEKKIYEFPEIAKAEAELGNKFNPNSTQQLSYLFFDMLGLPSLKRTATGAHSTDAEVLEYLQDKHPIVKHIGKIKKAKKIKATYIDKIIPNLNRDSKLRTFYNLTTTTSGRLSSSGKINMQQLPRDNKIVKACITAPEGYKIVSQDLATAEMYVAAVLSQDKKLMKVFIDGEDFHSSIAHMVFRLPCRIEEVKAKYPALRQAAKAISFGILYGSGPQKVADTVNAEGGATFSLEDANEAIGKYFGTFPGLKKWLNQNKQSIENNGFIYSIFDRKRRLEDVFSGNKGVASHEVRSGINFLVQSVASDINLLAGIKLHQHIKDNKLDAKIFGLVHDSILAIVKDEDLEEYLQAAARITQQNFGVMIPGCPIGIDQEVGQDYSFK